MMTRSCSTLLYPAVLLNDAQPLDPPPWKNPKSHDGKWGKPWSKYANSTFPGEGLHTLAKRLP